MSFSGFVNTLSADHVHKKTEKSLKVVDPFFKLSPSVIVQEDGVEMWRCNSGECISLEKKRDGRPDCKDR